MSRPRGIVALLVVFLCATGIAAFPWIRRMHRQSELERFVAANSTTAADDQAEFWEDPDAQAFQTPGRTTWR